MGSHWYANCLLLQEGTKHISEGFASPEIDAHNVHARRPGVLLPSDLLCSGLVINVPLRMWILEPYHLYSKDRSVNY